MIYQLSVTSLMTVSLHSTICSWMRRIRSLEKITATSNGGFYCAFINQLLNRGIVEITMPLSLNYLERYHSIV